MTPLSSLAVRARSVAAASVELITSHSEDLELIVFPINRLTLRPRGNPLKTGVECNVSDDFTGSGQLIAWSPAGSTLAFDGSGGIDEATVGPWSANCSQIGAAQMVIPDGYSPSWGASDDRNFTATAAR